MTAFGVGQGTQIAEDTLVGVLSDGAGVHHHYIRTLGIIHDRSLFAHPCKFIGFIPLQHIADNQLQLMRRRISKAETEELVARLRREIPDIALRTTMLVGFPGETEEDFEELCDFVQRVRFDRLGAFAYSEEEGTPSALTMEDNVPNEVKEERVERLMKLQKRISLALNAERVGKRMKVVIDRTEGEFYVGRSQYDSPEVDEEILVSSPAPLSEGDFVMVEITDCEEYDLYGKVVYEN